MATFIVYLIVLSGTINLIKMALFLIGSDIYEFNKALTNHNKKCRKYIPFISVVIPAHNEEKNIKQTIFSVLNSNYPKDRFEVIVADDGSTDNTLDEIKRIKRSRKHKNLKYFSQSNSGKANALNNAISQYAKGTLVMCLDADSQVDSNALVNVSHYFRDKRVVGVGSNVKIKNDGTLFSLIQAFEYIVNYQVKRALTTFNIEYIIGGIGSTFRRSFLKRVNYYDTNTVTEDIDLTLKIINTGNKKNRVIYASDVITYTESVLSFRDLIKQRLRWKFGRSQSFLKNKNLFFNRSLKYTKSLTMLFLPLAIVYDALFLFEPIMSGYLFYLILRYGDNATFISAFAVMFFYMIANVFLENTLSFKEKIFYLIISPPMYFFFHILTLAEYIGYLIFLLKLPNLNKSIENNHCSWVHVGRSGIKIP